jgi:hypothetical protein
MDALSLPLSNHMLLVVGTKTTGSAMLDLVARLALIKPVGPCAVRVLDGGNLFNAYEVARSICRQQVVQEGSDLHGDDGHFSLDGALKRIHLSRAFTCYQMVTLLEETPLDATPTCLLDLLTNFLDEAVRLEESRRLLQVCLAAVRRLSSLAPVIVSIQPVGPRHADRACLFEALQAAAGHVWEQKVIPAPPPPQPWW